MADRHNLFGLYIFLKNDGPVKFVFLFVVWQPSLLVLFSCCGCNLFGVLLWLSLFFFSGIGDPPAGSYRDPAKLVCRRPLGRLPVHLRDLGCRCWSQWLAGDPLLHEPLQGNGVGYSAAVFKDLSERHVDWRQVKSASFWSDGGRHFRSSAGIATIACRSLAKICAHSECLTAPPQAFVNFGLAAHFKNLADGAQAHVRSALNAAAAKDEISTIPSFISKCQQIFDSFSAGPARAPRFPCRFLDFRWSRRPDSCRSM